MEPLLNRMGGTQGCETSRVAPRSKAGCGAGLTSILKCRQTGPVAVHVGRTMSVWHPKPAIRLAASLARSFAGNSVQIATTSLVWHRTQL
jgi:hypothetical protein